VGIAGMLRRAAAIQTVALAADSSVGPAVRSPGREAGGIGCDNDEHRRCDTFGVPVLRTSDCGVRESRALTGAAIHFRARENVREETATV